MTKQMIETVNERIAEMVKDTQIQNIMMQFGTNEDAHEWLIKIAVATLVGK